MKLRNKKTGKIIELDYITVNEYIITLHTVNPETEEYCYSNLLSIYEEWEDYTPKEPLIKYESIRKAVRAWAEANDIGVIKIMSEFKVRDVETPCEISFWHNTFVCELVGNSYTIEELCGEEQE